ncbi:drug/metabolite transporter (DMT)-like permease [Geothermobacter ehrlichii]|uniref:Drug/metabolite transporter (DMT)-like permease n=1 Tax=Geothermobacter ehrlichii TaxID=213224 RepID=A0A5D3WL86_9BACT|nr:DMT family transporter [Geothermobacter ehrlichii]TYO99025.1 drug/metabolite transporter (DMT)-like permease [Geothermobacter ehrlichii]
MKNQRKAMAYGLVTVLLWSTVASAFKLSLRYLEPAHLLLYSGSFSTLLLAVILACQGKFGRVFRCSRGEYGMSLLLGLLNPFLYYQVLFKAYDLLPAQQAQPLNYTWAITLSLLAIPLLGQKFKWKEFAALLLSYCGVVVISTEGDLLGLHFSNPLGVALALASTVIWALYWIFNTRDRRDPVVALLANFLFGLPFVFGYCLLFTDLSWPPLPGLLGAVYVGTFEMGACFVFWLLAMKYAESTARVSNLIFLSPFLSLVLIHFLVGEEILSSTLVGLVLIVAGLIVQQWPGRKGG